MAKAPASPDEPQLAAGATVEYLASSLLAPAVDANPSGRTDSEPASKLARSALYPSAQRGREGRALRRTLQQQLTSTGPCQVVGGCVRSLHYPAHNFGTDETCVISGVPSTPIAVSAFSVMRRTITAFTTT
eukprot:3383473-Prymnesium_polylepis.2